MNYAQQRNPYSIHPLRYVPFLSAGESLCAILFLPKRLWDDPFLRFFILSY